MRTITTLLIVIILTAACNLTTEPSAESGEATIAPTKTLVSGTTLPTTDDGEPLSAKATALPIVSDCTPQTDWEIYTIQRGDNLTRIANQTTSTVDELIAANCLDTPNSLKVGQQLYVPHNPSQPTQPGSVANDKTYPGASGFAFDYPETWYITENTGTQSTIIVTSYAYVAGEDIPINEWTDAMVSLTLLPIPDAVEPGTLAQWVARSRQQFTNTANITSIGQAQPRTLASGLTGQMLEYENDTQTRIRNYYFIINGSKLQISVWGNFALADPIIQSLRAS